MRKNLLTLCWLLMAPTASEAEDGSGNYFMGGGAGSVQCPQFVASMDRAYEHGFGSLGYANEIQGFVNFIFGFQTAYNLQTHDTCDIFSQYGYDQLLAWTQNYCRTKPLEKFGNAVVALAEELHPKRARSCS